MSGLARSALAVIIRQFVRRASSRVARKRAESFHDVVLADTTPERTSARISRPSACEGLLQVWLTFFVPDGFGPAGDISAEHPTSDAGRPRTVPRPSTEAHHLGGVRPEVWTGPVAFTATVNGVASERVGDEMPFELALRGCDWNAFLLIPERLRLKWCSG